MSTIEDYKRKHLIIAVDFDGTIVDHDFPRIGKLMPGAKEVLTELHEAGHKIIIWTCRNHTEPDHPEWTQAAIPNVMQFLYHNQIPFDSINENHPDMGFWLQSRKVYADIYIDDKNIGGFQGWKVNKFLIEYFIKYRTWEGIELGMYENHEFLTS
jgi:hypothetical protein